MVENTTRDIKEIMQETIEGAQKFLVEARSDYHEAVGQTATTQAWNNWVAIWNEALVTFNACGLDMSVI